MDWQTLRNQFMRTIGGDPPGAQLEDWLINAYAEHPDAIERTFEKITLAHKAGKVHSPWGALKTEATKAIDAARNPTHNAGSSKTKALARAEQWIRTAGIHYDRQTEIIDELYGERGPLRAHPDTQPRILELWNELRPLGVILEADHEAYMARYAEQRARVDLHPKTTHGIRSEAELKAIAQAKGADTTRLIDKPVVQLVKDTP